jgi:hypothetical protein
MARGGSAWNCITGQVPATLRAMPLPRRRRRLPLLHLVVLGLFAMGLMLQPVLAAFGEVHGLAHDAGGLAQVLHADDAANDRIATGESGEDAATLHALLHFAHCCGTAAAILPFDKLAAFKPVRDRLLVPQDRAPVLVRQPAPFKPPIFA